MPESEPINGTDAHEATDAHALAQQLIAEMLQHGELSVQSVILRDRTELTRSLRGVTFDENKNPETIKLAQRILILLRGITEAYRSEWTAEAYHGGSYDLYAALDNTPWQREICRDPLSEMDEEKLVEARQLMGELLKELEALPKGWPDVIRDRKRRQLEETFAREGARGVHRSIGVGAALSDPDSRGAVVDLALELETASAA